MLCSSDTCTDLHQWWTCPNIQDIDHPDIVASQHLIEKAVAEHATFPFFWFRAIMTTKYLPTIPPSSPETQRSDPGDLYGDVWPAGVYGTDASGGAYGSIPCLRRCGCGIVSIDLCSLQLVFGRSFPLVGQVQTVPRAELYAMLVVVQRVGSGGVTIVTDSKVNYDLFYGPRQSALDSSNGDFWSLMFAELDSKPLMLTMSWVKSHLDSPQIHTSHTFHDADFALNYFADVFAGWAAKRVEVSSEVAQVIVEAVKNQKLVARRLSAILCSGKFGDRSFENRVESSDRNRNADVSPGADKRFKYDLQDLLDASDHILVDNGNSYTCASCFDTCAKGNRNLLCEWLGRPCVPCQISDIDAPVRIPACMGVVIGRRVVHNTHDLHSYRGIKFCTKCGARAVHKTKLLS